MSSIFNLDLTNRNTRESIAGIGFALPYMVIGGLFLILPMFLALYMSLHDWNVAEPAQSVFIGLEHYQNLIRDPRFWLSLRNTVYYVAMVVPATVIIALFLALGVSKDIAGKRVLRTIFFSPYVLTVSVVGVLWVDLVGGGGLLPYYLPDAIHDGSLLSSYSLAMPAIAIAAIWWVIGFNFIVLLAGRQSISDRLYEAAKLDGASSWRMMRDITIPQMINPIIFAVITSLISSFQVFGLPYVMTSGGPGDSTNTIVYYLYISAFTSREFGYAAAIGYVLVMILVATSAASYYFLQGDNK